jgi:hypothetical protein
MMPRPNKVEIEASCMCNGLLKAVKVMTRKSRYYDTEARTGITKTDCTKRREIQGRFELFSTYEDL